ncbi:MAG: dynamin family protein, partial [Trichodesmium sp. St16_bin4-tuft]|nr:dynamin family protein [Trichodesmium sp. St16_bin4-tuft]
MPEINDIINNRKANATTAIKKKEDLEELERKIKELQRLRPEIIKAPGITSVVSKRLEKVDLQGILDIITQERELWGRIEKRLNRDTINIAVVGLARQGKSTFLQQITLLTDAEIPASDGQPCTTTQSNIYHSPNESYGRVYFHSKSSFLEEVIIPYFKKLGFTSFPQRIEDFGRAQLPYLRENFSANDQSIYNHLKDEYYRHFSDYSHLLKNEKHVQKIRQDEIKEYVSQKYDLASQPTLFHHLAVEKVEIFCPFPNRGVEKIAVIDLPGLGDTRLGDAERMIKALAEDTDFILFIRKPNATGDFWGQRDVDLYDAAHQALEDKLPLEQWSFMLLNYD